MKPKLTTADIIPLSNIVSGLLASGHFTYDAEYKDDENLKRRDFGDTWAEDFEGDTLVYKQHMPEVLMVADELYSAVKRYCTSN